jgi:hypothetical protein
LIAELRLRLWLNFAQQLQQEDKLAKFLFARCVKRANQRSQVVDIEETDNDMKASILSVSVSVTKTEEGKEAGWSEARSVTESTLNLCLLDCSQSSFRKNLSY